MNSNEEYETINVDSIVSSNLQFQQEIQPYFKTIKEKLEDFTRYYDSNTCNLGIYLFCLFIFFPLRYFLNIKLLLFYLFLSRLM